MQKSRSSPPKKEACWSHCLGSLINRVYCIRLIALLFINDDPATHSEPDGRPLGHSQRNLVTSKKTNGQHAWTSPFDTRGTQY